VHFSHPRQLGELAISSPVALLAGFHGFHLQNRQEKSSKCAEGGQWDGALKWKAVRSECPQQYGQMTKEGETSFFIFSTSSWVPNPRAHAIFITYFYSNCTSRSWKVQVHLQSSIIREGDFLLCMQ